MTTQTAINRALSQYDTDDLAIGTLGSHSALNVFKGAREEGFKTVCICKESDLIIYRKFPIVDRMIVVKDFTELMNERLQRQLRELNTVLIPHGSFTAYLSTDQIMEDLKVPMFGNRQLLRWEADRHKQEDWLRKAGLRVPQTIPTPKQIKGLAIAKLPGAKGGRGYFLANSSCFHERVGEMIERGLLAKSDAQRIVLQEYVLGANVYAHYFSSIMTGEVEFLGTDKRYESAVDAIGRIPADEQSALGINPTYTIVGNIPITLRESLLPELMRMGDNVHSTAKKLAFPGIIGPFCLETIVTDTLEIFAFEISARIVAGTNVGIGTSPYAYLKYGEGMYIGRRIAKEIKDARDANRLNEILA